MAKIEDVIEMVQTKIIELKKLNTINVTKRIDTVVDFLQDVLDVATDAKEDQKFDIVQDVTGSATITYTVGGSTISAGSSVLDYGDELTITVTPATGYDLDTFTINGQNAVSGSTITVEDNVDVVVVATLKTFDLTQTVGEGATVTYTVDDETITAGTDVLSYGDVLTIEITADEAHSIASVTVNGESFTSGNTVTVTQDVVVVVTTEQTPPAETNE